MVDFKVFVKRFEKLEPFVRKEGNKILLTQGKEIVEMVKEQQHDGKNADAKVMQSGYSTGYGKQRKKKGLQTRFVDLHFTGKYHDKLKTVAAKEGVDVESNVDYEQYIRGNFPNSVGLTPENAQKTAVIISNILAPKIKKYLVG